MNWKVKEVFAMYDKRGIESNALYKEAKGHVGCMTCINTINAENAEIARRYPERSCKNCSLRGDR
ncbi:phosphoadenosine phosphosulfate reductase family protein [Paenibacillus antarcticus]|uniref:phosphoadenosine phosphosulfate reductase family protein n=1 Tax=Paenibacillus antarcticus TaxID=253703 RepID=UPI0023EA6E54|nr:phosphoadenosine phosphosulfate reductase family protein [Paenibacillus antarcticus]